MVYLEGLKYILHRDLAARNFLMTEAHHVKLADFGRARRVVDDHYQAERTELIPVKWAAPEVLANFDYSTKSDRVGLRAWVVWEVLSGGLRPYDSLTAEQTVVYVTEGGRLCRPLMCSDELYDVLQQCWRHSATSRPSFKSLHRQFKQKTIDARQSNQLSSPTSGGGGGGSDDSSGKLRNKSAPNGSVAPAAVEIRNRTVSGKGVATQNGGLKSRFSVIRDSLSPNGTAVRDEAGGRVSDSRTSRSLRDEVGGRVADSLMSRSFRDGVGGRVADSLMSRTSSSRPGCPRAACPRRTS